MEVTRKLTDQQREQADRIEDILKGAAAVEIRRMAELLASKSNGELFGQTEFQLRDILLGLGNRALDAALAERSCSSLSLDAKKGLPRLEYNLSDLS